WVCAAIRQRGLAAYPPPRCGWNVLSVPLPQVRLARLSSKLTDRRVQLGLAAARAHRLRLAFPTGELCDRERWGSRLTHGLPRLEPRRAFFRRPSPFLEGGEKKDGGMRSHLRLWGLGQPPAGQCQDCLGRGWG